MNELALVVAYWLSHPFRAVGVYLLAEFARVVIASIGVVFFRVVKKDRS